METIWKNTQGLWELESNIKEISFDVMHWMEIAEDRDRWKSLVNPSFNLQVNKP